MDWQSRPRCDETPAWRALGAHAAAHFSGPQAFDLRQAFAQDPARPWHLAVQGPHVYADLSRALIDAPARALLLRLAEECGLAAHRDAMLAGQHVNVSEDRPALHPLMRWPAESPHPLEDLRQIQRQSASELSNMLSFAEQVRAQGRFDDVVHIGIGGSDLGPRLALQALAPDILPDAPRVYFVANMDGHELAGVLGRLRSATRTLFVLASKSFGTAETLRNAQSARDWFLAQGGPPQALAEHFVALTARPDLARALGAGRCFTFPEGVGGRLSLWSVIGLPVALAVGSAGFRALLAGAHAMDQHFAQAPLSANLPVQLGLLDVWYRNFLHFPSRCVVPYHHGLRRLPAYLQQLEMESNGKRVDARGRAVPFDTAPVIWGEEGSGAQHAFFQLLHQGTRVVPVEFVAVRRAAHDLPEHQARLLANALAQARALMLGHADENPQRCFPGNRPSIFLLMDRLTPASLGALIALHEHRMFTSGSLWGLNSFDQWGVELGKRHSLAIEQALNQGDCSGLDPATAHLLALLTQPPPQDDPR